MGFARFCRGLRLIPRPDVAEFLGAKAMAIDAAVRYGGDGYAVEEKDPQADPLEVEEEGGAAGDQGPAPVPMEPEADPVGLGIRG